MRKHVVATALSLVLVLAQIIPVPSVQAAPGDFLSKWSARHYVPDAAGVAVDKDDNLYVTTPDSVQVYDNSGVLISKWGSYGSGDGQFSLPDGIAVDPNGKVYVADSGNDRIQVFDSSGAFLWKWADSDPSSIATDGESVYVLGVGSIRLYDNHGTLLTEFGRCDGCWNGLSDLTLTDEGLLYVFYYGDRPMIRMYHGTELIKTVQLDGTFGAITTNSQGKIYVAGGRPGSGPSPLEYLRIYDSELHQIGSLYERQMYNTVRHIAVDSKGNIFIAAAPMRVLDSAGNPRWVHWPQSLASDKSGNVYVIGGDFYSDDFSNKIEVFSSRGQLLRQWTGKFCETAGIAVDAGSNVHVSDYGYFGCFIPYERCCNARTAQVFDSSGNFIREYGVSSFSGALAIDINGRFLVAAGPGIDVYDSEGNFITCFSCPGERDELNFPDMSGIAVDRNGNIFVTANSTSVQVYDSTYRLIRTWGVYGTGDGQFRNATGIAVDGMGHVFVADSSNDRIQVFDEYGNFLLKWGGSGTLDGQFSAPHGILVDKSGAKVYVADQDNHRIQVFKGFAFPSTPCNMSGTVRQGSETGPALAGATVSIGGRTVTTDSTGAFSFTELAPGTYTLTISMAGYVTRTITEYVLDGDRIGQLFYLMEPTYTVSGAVREGSASGAPIAGVTVSMGGKTATTDKLGTFILTGIAGGTYTVAISKPGYVSKNSTGHVVDSNSSDLLFYLTPVYSLTGTVRQGSSTGLLLSGATVSIAGQTTTTGSTGTFSISGVLGGTYTLSISKAGYATKTVTGYVVDRDQTGLSLFLAPLTYSLSGTVRQGSATGPILPNATVAIDGKTSTTSSTGAFSITGIPAGTYTLTVAKSGYATKTVPGCIINKNTSGAVFYLSRAYTMSGTVRQGSATGPVLAEARVAIAGKSATTSSTGAFSITGIPPGTFTLTVSKPGFATKTVTGCVIYRNLSGMVFYLSPAYTISGTVRQGSATGAVLAGAKVVVAGKSTITSSTGAFTISGIPPGTYTLTISRTGYVTKTVTGVVVSSNKSGLVFFLSPSYTISGTVRIGSATGAVLAGAKVTVAGRSAITGSTGTFSIPGIPAGAYTLTISRTGYLTKTVTGYVVNSNKSGVICYLTPSAPP